MSDNYEDMSDSELTGLFIKLRTAGESLDAQYKEKKQVIDEKKKQVESVFLERMKANGNTTIKNENGSVARVIKERFWSTDWDSFKQFCKQHDVLDLFEHRISQRNMATFLRDNPDKLPAGLQVDRRYAVLVTKPRNKPE